MVDTISMSTKHGIKCYVGNIKLCDTCSYAANASLRKVNQLTGDECLWTGESVHSICPTSCRAAIVQFVTNMVMK